MTPFARNLFLAFTAGLLTGCAGGPPLQFYALAPIAGTQQPLPASGPALQVAAVHIPAALDRKALVRHTSSMHLQIDDSNQWAAPLADMIKNVLTRDLQTRLAPERVLPASAPAAPNTQRIVLNILSFIPRTDGRVVFTGSWSLLRKGQPTASYSLHAGAHPQAGSDQELGIPPATNPNHGANPAADQARAMSATLGQVADDIATTLARDK